MIITSTQNSHIKKIRDLQKSRHRYERKQFLVEGEREISRIPLGQIDTLYVTEPNDVGDACPTIQIAPSLMERLTYRGTTMLAVVNMKVEKLSGETLLLCADGIEKPGNLGAMLRTADGAGFEAVVSVGHGVDLYAPNVIRSSLGAFFTTKTCQMSAHDLIAYCTERNITMLVATPEAKTALYETEIPEKSCVIIGSEAYGVSCDLKQHAKNFSLPMLGAIDSLNASTTFGIIAYEIVRRRHYL